jgi:biopolymer transport protein TolQ
LANPASWFVWALQTGVDLEQVPVPVSADLLFLLGQTGPLARGILVILLLFSIGSWGVILSKTLLFKKIRRESEAFWRIFRKAHSLSEVSTACETLRFTPLVPVFDAGYSLVVPGSMRKSDRAALTKAPSPMAVERALHRAAAAQLTTLESRMTFLATTASATPFIGLLGTVIGVIGSFVGLANSDVATLRAVAPGIAEALIATAFGLFAAIPAVVFYNHFVAQIRRMGGQLDDLQAELLAVSENDGE